MRRCPFHPVAYTPNPSSTCPHSASPPGEPGEPVPVALGRAAAGLRPRAQLQRHAARVQLAGAVRGQERTPRQGHRAHVHCASDASW